ncbi:hypothetical protein HID58_001057, partial [Brassica napus]
IDLEMSSGECDDDQRINEGLEFESKEQAFEFYKGYAKYIGFNTIIKASRRSRMSGKFIDAKFVCTRYGTKKTNEAEEEEEEEEEEEDINIPQARKRGRRTNLSSSKTDCKACLHVKKRQDGRWVIRALVGQGFVDEINEVIYGSCEGDEFEERWCEVVDRFDVRDNDWLRSLYEDREHWVPVYMQDVSLAGMCSTDSVLDKYIQRKTTLRAFLDQYKRMMQERVEEEEKAEIDTLCKQPGLKSPSPFGKQMAELYTREMFKRFQVEVLGGVACHPKIESDEGNNKKMTFRLSEEASLSEESYNAVMNVLNEAFRKCEITSNVIHIVEESDSDVAHEEHNNNNSFNENVADTGQEHSLHEAWKETALQEQRNRYSILDDYLSAQQMSHEMGQISMMASNRNGYSTSHQNIHSLGQSITQQRLYETDQLSFRPDQVMYERLQDMGQTSFRHHPQQHCESSKHQQSNKNTSGTAKKLVSG